MVQFNLLPDVKIAYVKARRTQRLVLGIGLTLTAVAVASTVLLASVVYGVQKKHMADLDKDITSYTSKLKSIPDLDKIITVQNQLGQLNGLHDQKVVSSRAFQIVQQMTPNGVTISDLVIDFSTNSLTINGDAGSLNQVNTFVDTLKFAKHSSATASSVKPFTAVVLSQFSRSDKGATYAITGTFDPAIFSGAADYDLSVPDQVTSNSITGQPQDVFKKAVTSGAGQ